MKITEPSKLKLILIILLAGFAIRASVPIISSLVMKSSDQFLADDSYSYIISAESLVEGNGFSYQGRPYTHRTPGYPVVLVPGIAAGHVRAVTISIQIVLSLLTILLVYNIALDVFGNRNAAIFGAGIYAAEPLSVVYCSFILTETVFTFLVALSIYLLIRHIKTGGIMNAAFCGLTIAAAAFVRPIAYFLPFIAAALIIATAKSHGVGIKRSLSAALIFFIAALAPLLIWQARNSALTGYSGFSSIKEVNLLFYHAADIIARTGGGDFYDTQQEMREKYADENLAALIGKQDFTQGEKYAFFSDTAKNIIKKNPVTFIKSYLKGIPVMIISPGTARATELFSKAGTAGGMIAALFLTAILGSIYILSLIGLIKRRAPAGISAVLIITALYFAALSGGVTANSRFRHPVMPIVCIYAGAGLYTISGGHKNKKRTLGQNAPAGGDSN